MSKRAIKKKKKSVSRKRKNTSGAQYLIAFLAFLTKVGYLTESSIKKSLPLLRKTLDFLEEKTGNLKKSSTNTKRKVSKSVSKAFFQISRAWDFTSLVLSKTWIFTSAILKKRTKRTVKTLTIFFKKTRKLLSKTSKKTAKISKNLFRKISPLASNAFTFLYETIDESFLFVKNKTRLVSKSVRVNTLALFKVRKKSKKKKKKSSLVFFKKNMQSFSMNKWISFSRNSKNKNKKRSSRSHKQKTNFFLSPRFAVIMIFLLGVVALSGFKTHEYLEKIPNPQSVNDFPLPAATLIYDKNGTLLYSAYADSFRIPVELSKIPKVMQDATIAAEDQRFYKHRGFDIIAVLRSVINNFQGNQLQGGSTITQQVAKNSFLSNKKTISRKIEEAVISKRLEKKFTKRQILELYFNTVSYGGNTIGIKTASLHYFGKKVEDLTAKEAIFLASITPAPSIFSQEVGNKLLHEERISYVLDRMVHEKMLSSSQRKKIEEETLTFAPQLAYKRAPHAVDYVLSELEKKYGRDQVLKHGMIVKTSINLPLQNYTQQIVLKNVSQARANNLTNTGVIIVSPKDGAILAMVGSSNYYDQDGGQYNTVTAKRQLGSAMKIITYARAFEDGMTPFTTISDSPTKFVEYPDYKPRNYDGKFHGNITLKSAFANSYNIPALKLAYNLGLDRIADLGYRMGIEEFNFGDQPKPLSMAIGGVEVSLLNLVQAYSVAANQGIKVKINPVEEIRDHNGKLIYKKEIIGEQVISQNSANAIFSILSDNVARLPAFGRSYHLEFGNDRIAVKTGTSNDVKDNVAIAFDDDFVVGVWAGNNDSTPMWGIISGYSAPTLTMHEVVLKMLAEYPQKASNLSVNVDDQKRN